MKLSLYLFLKKKKKFTSSHDRAQFKFQIAFVITNLNIKKKIRNTNNQPYPPSNPPRQQPPLFLTIPNTKQPPLFHTIPSTKQPPYTTHHQDLTRPINHDSKEPNLSLNQISNKTSIDPIV